MTILSVNINKVAVIRNSRGGNVPNVVKVALDCERFGADGITVHPRPDERHIMYADVYDLKEVVTTQFNIEGYPTEKFVKMVCDVKPTQVTLVPDPPEALTSSAGWNVQENFDFLKEIIAEFQKHDIRTSIFVETDLKNMEWAAKTNSNRVELYTEPYATGYTLNKEEAIHPFIFAAKKAQELGLEVNAGHDLSLENLGFLITQIPFIDEVSIGHALISDALYYGLENTVQLYKRLLVN